MLYRLRRGIQRWKFNRGIGGVLSTPPLHIVDAPLSIISMVSNADVPMYLLSLKSFYRRIGRGKVIAIIDRDMPESNRDTLRRHIVGIRFAILEDIDVGTCQRGGTWERLVYLIDHARTEYAIQLDSDTLTCGGDLSEIIECVDTNTAFTLGSNAGRPIESMLSVAEFARTIPTDYVGVIAERLFERYPNGANLKYVRGSSGLAGFAVGGFDRAQLEDFHREMELLLKERWREWGSEQCGSNFAVANSKRAIVLPFPKYANFVPHIERGTSSFFHFIGSYRYAGNHFVSLGQTEIEGLNHIER